MQHILIPPFILERYAAGERLGELDAAALFVDVSGFTPLTAALMQHGKAGAEAVADALLAVFEPLIQKVSEQGGFVATFAGDAFLALFPASDAGALGHGLAAGRDIQAYMAGHAEIFTPFGAYPFSVRLGLAYGRVAWGILGDEGGEQHTCYFRGEAVEHSARAQRQAGRGELCLSPEFEAALAAQHCEDESMPGEDAVSQPAPIQLQERFFIPELLASEVRGEFRDVVSVFINLPGGLGHEDLAAFVRVVYRLLDAYGGYLCRLGLGFAEQGCSLLLFWGAPACYENDLSRALRFLLALRDASPLAFRAGVTQQVAYAGYVGCRQREEYTCHGSWVNLANRLMGSAGWGEIWADEGVKQRSGERFGWGSLGERAFKGFAQPLGCHALLGRIESGPRPYEGEMVGRDAELERLREWTSPLFAGKFAGWMGVYGEPGMGKSRLVQALRQRMGGQATWLVGQSDQVLHGSLNPFRYLLQGYFEQVAVGGEAENKLHFERKLAGLIAALRQKSENELAAELERTRSFLGALVGLRWEGSLYEQLEPKLRFENSLYALKALIQGECRCRPVVLMLEDVHWLDGDSHTLLEMLTHNMAGYPLAIVATCRYQDDGSRPALSVAADAPQEVLELGSLSPQAVDALAQRLLGGVASPGLVSLLIEKTNGNPFFVEQVVLDLRERGLLEQAAGGWSLMGDGLPAELPANIQAVLLARLDRLNGEVKAVVQTAAVLGREFEVQVLSAMLRGDEGLPEKMHRAEEETIWSALNELRYLFRHALLRDAAYEMQLRSRLRDLHALAAESLQQVYAADLSPHYADLAYHCDRAENSPEALRWYRLAGEWADERYANEDAHLCYSRALALSGELGQASVSAGEGDAFQAHFDLLALREAILDRIGDRPGQWADLQAMAALAQNDRQRCKVLQRKILRHRILSERVEEKNLIEAFKQQATLLKDPAWEAEAYYTEGLYYTLVDEKSSALASLSKALALRQAIGDIAGQMDCCCALALVYLKLWEHGAAMQWIERAQALKAEAERSPGRYSPRAEQLSFVLRSAASAALIHKDQLLCYQYANQLLELTTIIGDHKRKGSAYLLLGQALSALFQIEEGMEALRASLQMSQDAQDRHSTSIVLGEFAYQYLSLGDFDQAGDYFRRSMAIDQETHYPHGYCTSLLNLSYIALCQEDALQAKETSRQGERMAAELENDYLRAIAIGNLGEAEQLLGEYDASLAHTYQSIELLDRLDQPAEVAIMQIDLAITYLKMGEMERALEFAEKLVAAFPAANLALNDAQRLLWGAARVFHATGQAERAATILAEAYRLYNDKRQQIPEPRVQAAYCQMKFNRQIVAAFEADRWPE